MAKQSLLLVDGDAKSLRVLEVSLKKAGYNVTTAPNGADALDKVQTAQPDLIISDTQMEGTDGFEFCRELKDNPDWRSIPFIFLTSQAKIEHKIKGLELGVEDYLTKPIYIKEILTRVRILLQKTQRARLGAKREKRTRFSGHLADMGVVDLIQTVEVGAKSGVIHMTDEESGHKGTIYFRDGKVIDAELGHLHGEDAVYRMLTWSDGEFEFVFRNVRRKEVIAMSSQGLLMEGMRRLDEWGRLLEQLPPLDTRFEIDYEELRERLAELPDELNTMLRLFDGRRSLVEIIDHSEYGDLEGLEVVSKLYFEGLIVESSAEDLPEDIKGDPALEGWLAGPRDATSETIPVSPSQAHAAIEQVARTEEASRNDEPAVEVPPVGLPAVSSGLGYTDHALPDDDLDAIDDAWEERPPPSASTSAPTTRSPAAVASAEDTSGDFVDEVTPTTSPPVPPERKRTPPTPPGAGASEETEASGDGGVRASEGAAVHSVAGEVDVPTPPPEEEESARRMVTIEPSGAHEMPKPPDDAGDRPASDTGKRDGASGDRPDARATAPLRPKGRRSAPVAAAAPPIDDLGDDDAPASRPSRAGSLALAAAVLAALLGVFLATRPGDDEPRAESPAPPAPQAPAAAPAADDGDALPDQPRPGAAVPREARTPEPGADPSNGTSAVARPRIPDSDRNPDIRPTPPTRSPDRPDDPQPDDPALTSDRAPEVQPDPPAPDPREAPPRDSVAQGTDPEPTTDDPAADEAAEKAARRLASARRAFRRSDYERALASVDAALATEPRNADALALKADILLGKRNPAAALAAANDALSASRRAASAWLTKGMAHYELEDYGAAKTALARYLKLRPRARNADEIRLLLDSL